MEAAANSASNSEDAQPTSSTGNITVVVTVDTCIEILEASNLSRKWKVSCQSVEAARKFNINAVNCYSVLRVTCPCCFVCVCFLFLSLF